MTILSYLLARLGEASTYAALAGLLAALHVSIDPGLWQHVVDAGLAIAALAGILLTEKGGAA